MDSSSSSSAILKVDDKESMVDPFLVEALQNPRHRLTILRMELDVQRFLKNPDIQQFEFQQFPTSYLRLAAHRVAQHYGLTTAVQENLDSQGNTIVARKTVDSRYPAVCLSEIPAKHQESEKSGKIKVLIKPRKNNSSDSADNEFGTKRSPSRTVEDREEEYERARARIFSSNGSPVSGDNPQGPTVGKDQGLTRNDFELSRNLVNDPESYVRDGSASCVAIIRDVEKDRFDPDYDRSYERYARNLPTDQSYVLRPFQVEKPHLPYMHYSNHACFPQYGMVPRAHTSVNFGFPSNAVMAPFGAMGINMSSADSAYLQWRNHAMMQAHSYEQFRHAISLAPFGQHPPSLNHHQQNLMNRS